MAYQDINSLYSAHDAHSYLLLVKLGKKALLCIVLKFLSQLKGLSNIDKANSLCSFQFFLRIAYSVIPSTVDRQLVD